MLIFKNASVTFLKLQATIDIKNIISNCETLRTTLRKIVRELCHSVLRLTPGVWV